MDGSHVFISSQLAATLWWAGRKVLFCYMGFSMIYSTVWKKEKRDSEGASPKWGISLWKAAMGIIPIIKKQ